MAANGDTSDTEQPFLGGEKFQEMYKKAWESGNGHIAEQVMSTDLNDAAKVNILHIVESIDAKSDTIYFYRRVTTALFILQAATGAVVPILIPFGQTYEGKSRVVFGHIIRNLGEFLLLVAVVCSLAGSIAMVVERAGKFSKLSYAYNKEQEQKDGAIGRFLALGGKYRRYTSHKDAYPGFIDDMWNIFECNSRAKIFGGVMNSENDQSEGQPAASNSTDDEK